MYITPNTIVLTTRRNLIFRIENESIGFATYNLTEPYQCYEYSLENLSEEISVQGYLAAWIYMDSYIVGGNLETGVMWLISTVNYVYGENVSGETYAYVISP